jgi:hypothetical protein
VREMDAYTVSTFPRINSLFLLKNSLFFKIFSLLICVGNYAKTACSAAVSRSEIGLSSLKIAKFPVNFPVSRELRLETGSHMTAHTTIAVWKTL